jgi:Skp family chaperone for outer membrane proteins
MKILALLVMLGVLGGATYLGSRAGAQPAAPPRPQSRIALLNIAHVLKNYEKAVKFQAEAKQYMNACQDQEKKERAKLDSMAKEMQQPGLSQDVRYQKERELKTAQRNFDDWKTECQAQLYRKQEEQLLLLYREIQYHAANLANSAGFEMVLHFNDADPGTAEYLSALNVSRKFQAGACMPLYVAQGLDISHAVVDSLHAAMRGNNPAPASH